MPKTLYLALVNVSERLALERIVADAGHVSAIVDDLPLLLAGPVPSGLLIVDDDLPGLDLAALLDWHRRRPVPDSEVLVRCLAEDQQTRALALRLGALDVLPRPGGLGLVLARLASLRMHELRLAQYLRSLAPAAAGLADAAVTARRTADASAAEAVRLDPELVPAVGWDAGGPLATSLGAELVNETRRALQGTLARWTPTADFRAATPEDIAVARRANPWIATTAVAVRAAGMWIDVTIYAAEQLGVAHATNVAAGPNADGAIGRGTLGCVLSMLARCAAGVAREHVSGPVDVLPNCVHRRDTRELHPLAEASLPGTSRWVLVLRGRPMIVDLGARHAARRRRRISDLRPGDVLLDDLPGLKPSDPPLLGRGTVLDSRRLDLLRTLPASVAESREVGVLVPSERYLTQID